jgi:hypothetical protein
MSSLIERLVSDKKNNLKNSTKHDYLSKRNSGISNSSCIRLKDNYILNCVKFDENKNTASFPKLEPACKVMFDLLKKCRNTNQPVTFSGP